MGNLNMICRLRQASTIIKTSLFILSLVVSVNLTKFHLSWDRNNSAPMPIDGPTHFDRAAVKSSTYSLNKPMVQHKEPPNNRLQILEDDSKSSLVTTLRPLSVMPIVQKTETPRLALVSVCIPGDRFNQEYINVSRTNKLIYCNRYNASCILPTERVDRLSKLHKKWDKLYYINQTLHTFDVDWILWMDCDAAFTNFEINWYSHLKNHLKSSQLMIVSKDKQGINLGVFLVPNTEIVRKFIVKMYNLRHVLDKKFFHKDQSALKQLLKTTPGLESKFEIVDQVLINSYLDNKAGIKWTPYDFIVHQVFCQDPKACSTNFTQLLKKVTPHYFPKENEDRLEIQTKPNESMGLLRRFRSWWNRTL